MGLFILEPNLPPGSHVPGTTRMLDHNFRDPELVDASVAGLKHDTGRNADVVLVPQPSEDPNDPLNWSLTYRDFVLFVLCMASVIAAVSSPILATNSLLLIFKFGHTFDDIAALTGYNVLMLGLAAPFFSASSRVFGKRHVYLLGTMFLFAGCLWSSFANSYKSFLGSRILQGIGICPFECLLYTTIGDLYHIHQRGTRVALSTMALFGSTFLTPVITGKLTKDHDGNIYWPFYLLSGFGGLAMVAVAVLIPETVFVRDKTYETDIVTDEHFKASTEQGTVVQEQSEKPSITAVVTAHQQGSDASIQTQRKSYLQTLLPFTPLCSPLRFFTFLVRPLPLLFMPSIFWGCLSSGSMIAWTVMLSAIVAELFSLPPLWFDEAKVGYIYASPFIGATVGLVVAGMMSDWSVKYLTRKNNGVYEPEFRIPLMAGNLIIGCMGLFGFGLSMKAGDNWPAPTIFFGLMVFGLILASTSSLSYLIDAHRDLSTEIFVCLLLFKGLLSFGLTLVAYDWVLKRGVKEICVVMGCVQIGICLLSIPMYVLGKRNRAWMARNDVLKRLKLK